MAPGRVHGLGQGQGPRAALAVLVEGAVDHRAWRWSVGGTGSCLWPAPALSIMNTPPTDRLDEATRAMDGRGLPG
jgi:hypothetical protein